MLENRKTEEFEDDRRNWKIYFDLEDEGKIRGERNVFVSFILNNDEKRFLTEKDLEKLKRDLKDLGKFRIIKQGREFLEK